MRQWLGLAERFGELDRARPPLHRAVVVVLDHAELRDVRVGHRELATAREALEHVDRGQRCRLDLGAAPDAPQQTREPAQRVTLAVPIAERTADLEQLARAPGALPRAARR